MGLSLSRSEWMLVTSCSSPLGSASLLEMKFLARQEVAFNDRNVGLNVWEFPHSSDYLFMSLISSALSYDRQILKLQENNSSELF